MEISYHSVLTKIQKLQKFKKKKKKNFFFYRPVCPVPASIARNCPVQPVRGRYSRYFFRYETEGSSVPDYWPVRYIPAGTVRNWQPCSSNHLPQPFHSQHTHGTSSLTHSLLFIRPRTNQRLRPRLKAQYIILGHYPYIDNFRAWLVGGFLFLFSKQYKNNIQKIKLETSF